MTTDNVSLSAVGNDSHLRVVPPFNEMAVNFTRERWKPGFTLKWDDLVKFILFGASASPPYRQRLTELVMSTTTTTTTTTTSLKHSAQPKSAKKTKFKKHL